MTALRSESWTELGATPRAEPQANLSETEAAVQSAYERLRAAERADPVPSFAWRRDALRALGAAVRRRVPELVAAADADFGGRSATTTKIGDVATTLRELDYMLGNLRAWMAPERRRVALHFQPARAELLRQPLGVVGVIAPWNYPFRLALGPMAAALAAGNRVLLKPSELAPRSAAELEGLIDEAFSADQVQVLRGGQETARALLAHPLDHVFFTGSTSVGRELARLASRHLVPLTLELGGKCPAIIHPDAPLERAARRIVAGKLFNAGQTCMAPDHVWVHEADLDRALAALRAEICRQFPTLRENPDYTSVINAGHVRRLSARVTDARERGARVDSVSVAGETLEDTRKVPPTLISGVTDAMAIAHDEIFGPLLPVRTYTHVEELTQRLRALPSPLAAYYFDPVPARAKAWLSRSRSGGACINDVILHSVQDDLPFGGVGASGFGRYHAREGFETFSHQRAVLYQTPRNLTELLIPPYGSWARRAIEWLCR